jgi:hypothetical protein
MHGCGHGLVHTDAIVQTVGLYSNRRLALAQTLVGEYTIPGSEGGEGTSIALDETTNTLYVGSITTLYKLDAGSPLVLPSLLQNLTLDVADGGTIYGLTLDVVNGFGERICKGEGW